MSQRQVCPFHADEDVLGQREQGEDAYAFTCERTQGHPSEGTHNWIYIPEPAGEEGLTGMADELGLHLALPAAIASYPGQWIEYGVVEAQYATANPADFALLVQRYSHTAIAAKQYTASAFLASTLGRLSRTGHVLHHSGPATGRWDYNPGISWWALPPAPNWENRLSWAELGRDMSYVPHSVE